MRVTIPLEIEHTDLLYYFDCEFDVGKPHLAYSDQRGNFGPMEQEIELQSALLTGIVLTTGPSDEIHCTENDPLPSERWQRYVEAWLEARPDEMKSLQLRAAEQAGEDEESAREAAEERAAEDRHERWLEARGLA